MELFHHRAYYQVCSLPVATVCMYVCMYVCVYCTLCIVVRVCLCLCGGEWFQRGLGYGNINNFRLTKVFYIA